MLGKIVKGLQARGHYVAGRSVGRILSVLVWIALSASWVAFAGTFEGLVPGVSTKADADRVLGAPIRVVVQGSRYDYDPGPFEAQRISIECDPMTGIIRRIDLYLKERHPRSTYQEWIQLGDPDENAVDADGNRVERWVRRGVSLHFSGPDDTSPVDFLRHFDSRQVDAGTLTPRLPPTPAPLPEEATPQESPTRTYLGVVLTPHEGMGFRVIYVTPGSPAERAGLQAGDVILEVGETGIYRKVTDGLEVSQIFGQLPVGVPIPLLFERGSQQFRTTAVMEEREKIEVDRLHHRIVQSSYAEGQAWVQKKKCKKALPPLHRAYWYGGRQNAEVLGLIGYCHFSTRQYQESLAAYQGVLTLVPDSPVAKYFIGACYDQLDDREKAVEYYGSFLAAHNGNKRMIKFARHRIEALTSEEPERDWGQTLADVIEAVQQEVGDPPQR